MAEALVTLPDGRKAKVTFTDQAQLDATIADLTKPAKDTPAKTSAEPPGAAKAGPHGNVGVGAAETALKLGTGLASSAAGGVAGLARGVGAGAAALAGGEGLAGARDAFSQEASDTIKAVGEGGTYQPRTAYGKLESALVEAPFKLLAKGANVAGEKTAEVTGSPALGAAVNTAIQSAPAIVGAKIGRVAGAEGGGEAAGASRGAGAAQDAASRAKAYAGNLGLDWTRLPAELQTTLTRIAGEAGNLEKLNPEAVKRQALLASQKIPIATTRGKLTRDPVELRREAVASTTAEGQPIRDVDIAANRDLQANLEVLRGKVAGKRGGLHDPNAENAPTAPSVRAPTKAQADVGASVQSELRGKAKASKAAYDALYKKARETDPDAKAPLEPVTRLLTDNPEIQHLGWVSSWLSKASKAAQKGEEGPQPVTEAKLAELHDLRSTANDIARTGGKEGYYAGKVVKAIDETMESVPEGAKAWKQANEAFKRHQKEFKDQALIKQLVTNKGGDRALALEKTWNTIAKAPVEKIRQVKQSLLTQEGDVTTRMQGRAAWRDLRGETVNRILEDARNVVATDETERSILTAAALRKSINSVGRDRLTEILGKRNTDQLYDLLRAAKITRTDPAHRVTESGTVPNALVLAEKILKHIPGAKTVVGAKHAISDLTERGRAADAVKQSTKTPLQIAAEEAEKNADKRNAAMRRRTLTLRAARGLSPGVGEVPNRQSPEP